MSIPCTGVILAGGLNTRFSGKNKAFVRVRGVSIFDRIYALFEELFDEVVLITNDPLQYLDRDVMIGTDLLPVRSSLTGIHAGLFCASHPHAFFIACDTPFLKKEMVMALVENIGSRADVIIPETSKGLEPLCAVYSKQCLHPVERNLNQGKFKIRDFFKSVRVKKIPEKLLRDKDPELISFFNVNTPEELAKAQQIAEKEDL